MLTNTDEALAQFYLQDREWDLEVGEGGRLCKGSCYLWSYVKNTNKILRNKDVLMIAEVYDDPLSYYVFSTLIMAH